MCMYTLDNVLLMQTIFFSKQARPEPPSYSSRRNSKRRELMDSQVHSPEGSTTIQMEARKTVISPVYYLQNYKSIQCTIIKLFSCRWILARYDIDVFDYRTNKTVNVESAPLNTGVDIPKFDYSRKEVEVCSKPALLNNKSFIYSYSNIRFH